jgi:hypothetical protein
MAQNPQLTRGAQPVSFFANRGQAPQQVLWEARGPGFGASFGRDSFVLRVFPAKAGAQMIEQRISLDGISREARIEALDQLPARFSFFGGRDSSHWVRGVETYSRLRYRQVYPGVDLVFYGNHGKLEYDFVVAPGADPAQIRIRADGAAHVTKAGDLELGEGLEAAVHRPALYQNTSRGKNKIDGRFVARANDIGFDCGTYDRKKILVIDPTVNLLYATYLGGVHDDQAYAMTVDAQRNAYILGESPSQDFPVSANAYQSIRSDMGTDIVVTKMSPSGVLLYSTFIGVGSGVGSGQDHPSAIAVDQQGNAWIMGSISGANASGLAVTANAYQSTFQSQGPSAGSPESVYFSELSGDGSALLYSSFFSGTGGTTITGANLPSVPGSAIAVDASGHVFLTALAGPGLPATSGAYLGSIAAGALAPFIAKFDTTQTGANQLLGATYVAPANPTSATAGLSGATVRGLALDLSGNPWIVGSTFASNFPTTSNAIQPSVTLQACGFGAKAGDPLDRAGYVAKLSSDLTTLLYGSYLHGPIAGNNPSAVCYEDVTGAAVDASGNLYVAGVTTSNQFPTTQGAYQPAAVVNVIGLWQFVAKIAADGSQIDWGTYLGQGDDSNGPFIGLDALSNVWTTSDVYMPTTSNRFPGITSGEAMAQLSSDGSTLLYGSFLPLSGAISRAFAVDAESNTYFAGITDGGFLTTPNAFQSQFANGDPNPDGADEFFAIFGGGVISTLTPSNGGNVGDTTITITGGGFQSGATCSLMQGATAIQAVSVLVNASGTSATCTFALNGAAAGTYDVAVSNPDGSGSTDKGAFTVVSGGSTGVWTSLSGRSAIRVGVPSSIMLSYGNNGTTNAYVTTIWLVLPASYTFSIAGLTAPSDPNCPLLNNTPMAIQSGNFNYIPLIVPVIPAGYSNSLVVTVTAPSVAAAQELIAYAEAPWFDSIASATSVLGNAISAPASVAPGCVASPTDSSVADCLGAMSAEVEAVVLADLTVALENDPNVATDTTVELASILSNWVNFQANPGQIVLPAQVLFTQVGADLLCRLYGTCNACALPNFLTLVEGISPPKKPAPWVITCPSADQIGFGIDFLDGNNPCFPQGDGSSIDPNEKTGPAGDGSASRFVGGANPFTYTIAFENQATATLPAAQVVVTDALNPTTMNLSTLALSKISFGANVINIPANTSNFSTTFPVNSGLSVKIQGSLDPDTSVLKWTFSSIDPSTGLPPSDPTVGFLPPDTDGVEGQGAVTFTISPKSGQATGTQIPNQASVVFDTNAPINTAVWTNTLDVNPPHSSVAALPAQEAQSSFTVSWSGTDVGSGIATYTIFVSDNGAPYTIFQNTVTSTSATFSGQAGHAYSFYSLAMDGAGNVEAAKTTPDATTMVTGGGNATTTSASPVSTTFSPSTQQITLSATVSSGAGTVNAGSVSFTLLGSSVSGNVTNGSASASFTVPAAQAAGVYTIQAVYNAAGGFATSSDLSKQLSIGKATPAITWVSPAAIPFGSALGSGQLNATANAAGTFVYTPPAGTVLPQGNGQTLSVMFTPSDSNDYVSASANVTINVLAPPSGGPPNLVLTKTLSRNENNQIVALVTIANTGGSAAASVQITGAKIGSTLPVTVLPVSMGAIGANTQAQVTITFPASAGASGAASTISLSGTYGGGSFSSTTRVTLP